MISPLSTLPGCRLLTSHLILRTIRSNDRIQASIRLSLTSFEKFFWKVKARRIAERHATKVKSLMRDAIGRANIKP